MFVETSTLRYVEQAYKLTAKFGLLPFIFDSKKRKNYLNNSNHFYWHFTFNRCVSIVVQLYLTLCVYTNFQLRAISAVSHSYWIFWIIIFIVYPVCIHLDYMFWNSRAEMNHVTNSIINLVDSIEDNFGPYWTAEEKEKDRLNGKLLRKILKSWQRAFVVVGPIAIGVVLPIIYGHEAMLMTGGFASIVENTFTVEVPYWMVVTTAAFLFAVFPYVVFCASLRLYAMVTITFSLCWYFNYILSKKLSLEYELKPQNGDSSSVECLRHPRNAIKVYRTIFTCWNIIMDTSTNFIALVGSLMMITCSFLLYLSSGFTGALLSERFISLFIFLFIGTIFTYLFETFGKFHMQSSDLINSWSNFYVTKQKLQVQQNWRVEKRILRGLRPFSSIAGSIFVIDSRISLIFWDSVIDKTILLLECFPLS